MKKILLGILALSLSFTSCIAQSDMLSIIYKGAKNAKDARKEKMRAKEDWGNTKVKDLYKDVQVDTTSVEFKQALAKAQQELYNSNPVLKRIMELQGDSVGLKKYMEEHFGGLSQEEAAKKLLEGSGFDSYGKELLEDYSNPLRTGGLYDDPVYKDIMAEQRQPTREEITYLNDKYGTSFEYQGMEALNDSVGVYARLENGMKPMGITTHEITTDERPLPDIGQDVKQYVQDWIALIKEPLADREVIEKVQNYMVYGSRHADEQFKGVASFTLYSNPETNYQEMNVSDFKARKISDFTEPIDPKNIFVFKVHRGIDCRFMEYMYSEISYMQSEKMDYVREHLINGGYIDANINQNLSDDELFKVIDKIELQFKVEKLLKIRQDKEKFLYTNSIPAAKNVKITSNTRKIDHVTALDVNIKAEPGEYAFIILNPEVEQYFKQMKEDSNLKNFDISVLTQGAFFFTIRK